MKKVTPRISRQFPEEFYNDDRQLLQPQQQNVKQLSRKSKLQGDMINHESSQQVNSQKENYNDGPFEHTANFQPFFLTRVSQSQDSLFSKNLLDNKKQMEFTFCGNKGNKQNPLCLTQKILPPLSYEMNRNKGDQNPLSVYQIDQSVQPHRKKSSYQSVQTSEMNESSSDKMNRKTCDQTQIQDSRDLNEGSFDEKNPKQKAKVNEKLLQSGIDKDRKKKQRDIISLAGNNFLTQNQYQQLQQQTQSKNSQNISNTNPSFSTLTSTPNTENKNPNIPQTDIILSNFIDNLDRISNQTSNRLFITHFYLKIQFQFSHQLKQQIYQQYQSIYYQYITIFTNILSYIHKINLFRNSSNIFQENFQKNQKIYLHIQVIHYVCKYICNKQVYFTNGYITTENLIHLIIYFLYNLFNLELIILLIYKDKFFIFLFYFVSILFLFQHQIKFLLLFYTSHIFLKSTFQISLYYSILIHYFKQIQNNTNIFPLFFQNQSFKIYLDTITNIQIIECFFFIIILIINKFCLLFYKLLQSISNFQNLNVSTELNSENKIRQYHTSPSQNLLSKSKDSYVLQSKMSTITNPKRLSYQSLQKQELRINQSQFNSIKQNQQPYRKVINSAIEENYYNNMRIKDSETVPIKLNSDRVKHSVFFTKQSQKMPNKFYNQDNQSNNIYMVSKRVDGGQSINQSCDFLARLNSKSNITSLPVIDKLQSCQQQQNNHEGTQNQKEDNPLIYFYKNSINNSQDQYSISNQAEQIVCTPNQIKINSKHNSINQSPRLISFQEKQKYYRTKNQQECISLVFNSTKNRQREQIILSSPQKTPINPIRKLTENQLGQLHNSEWFYNQLGKPNLSSCQEKRNKTIQHYQRNIYSQQSKQEYEKQQILQSENITNTIDIQSKNRQNYYNNQVSRFFKEYVEEGDFSNDQ